MGWFLLIGLFCLLAVIGFFVTGSPFKFALGGMVFLIATIFVLLAVIVIWTMAAPCSAPFTDHSSTYCQNHSGSTSISNSSVQLASNSLQQTAETSDDPFPVQDIECNSTGCPQYAWYDRHNVAMAYRCYTGTQCTAQQWASAVYNNSNDPRGQTLEQEASSITDATTSQYPSGKCVTESGVQICDLSYNVISQSGNTRTIKMQGNEIVCQDMTTGTHSDVRSDTTDISSDQQFCATDLGTIYIDPSVQVTKHYGAIQTIGSSYTVPDSSCIWTYAGGNGDIPYIQTSNQTGPDSSFYNVRAFCENGSNRIDIFSAT